jgi:hypothetical protein
MAFVRKLSLAGSGSQTITGTASTYVGDINDIWADDVDFNTIRRGDGSTPGGVPIGSSGAHFSGQWVDVIGKPTTVSGFGITDAVTSSSVDTFTNKSGNISLWINDSGYLTSVPAQTFASLTGKPTTITGFGITDAFDGAYASLSGLPTIPTNNNQLTNGAGFITSYIDTTYTAGSGLTLTGTVFSNTSPDQTVTITGTGATSASGTYPNFTISSTDTTYVSSDFIHDDLAGFVANEHIDWTSASAGTIDTSNYTDTDTTYNIIDNGIAGNYNLGVGDSALNSINSNGATQHNTAVGFNSSSSLVSGASNTTVGSFALFGNVSGSHNIAMGTNALSSNVSGTNNTAIGTFAGQLNTGSENVFIGFNAGQNQTSASNKLYIANNNSSTLIGGDFITGTVTFNDAYTFPSTDGTASQVLTTDGAGNLSWVVSSSEAEQDFSIHTAVFNATAGSRHAVDTSSTAVTATLPASPATGDAIFFADAGGNYATNNLTIGRNGNTIMDSATDMTVSTNNQSFGLFYNGSTWRIY